MAYNQQNNIPYNGNPYVWNTDGYQQTQAVGQTQNFPAGYSYPTSDVQQNYYNSFYSSQQIPPQNYQGQQWTVGYSSFSADLEQPPPPGQEILTEPIEDTQPPGLAPSPPANPDHQQSTQALSSLNPSSFAAQPNQDPTLMYSSYSYPQANSYGTTTAPHQAFQPSNYNQLATSGVSSHTFSNPPPGPTFTYDYSTVGRAPSQTQSYQNFNGPLLSSASAAPAPQPPPPPPAPPTSAAEMNYSSTAHIQGASTVSSGVLKLADEQPARVGTRWDSERLSADRPQVAAAPDDLPSYSFPKAGQAAVPAPRPSYISVPQVVPQGSGFDLMKQLQSLEPSVFLSIRAYSDRALARCKSGEDKEKIRAALVEMLKSSHLDGSLGTRNWDTEPLLPMPQTREPAGHLHEEPKSAQKVRRSRWDPEPSQRHHTQVQPAAVLAQQRNLEARIAHNAVLPAVTPTAVSSQQPQKQQAESAAEKERADSGTSRAFHVKFMRKQKGLRSRLESKGSKGVFGAEDDNDAAEAPSSVRKRDSEQTSPTLRQETEAEVARKERRALRFQEGAAAAGGGSKGEKKRGGSRGARAKASSSPSPAPVLTGPVKGVCQTVEKSYFRLTSAPDPETVRPEPVLKQALELVRSGGGKGYKWQCDQLKSIRQDLTVQGIRSVFVIEVYETHARLALKAGDLSEYNQCQSQLGLLYKETETEAGLQVEFTAYNLLYLVAQGKTGDFLQHAMAKLSPQMIADPAVAHALAVRKSKALLNYAQFFKLYRSAPNLNRLLMDVIAENVRFEAVKAMAKAYRPSLPVKFIASVLAFDFDAALEQPLREQQSSERCAGWLRAHGSLLIHDSEGQLALDTKASAPLLFVPEPEDLVAHGDPTLNIFSNACLLPLLLQPGWHSKQKSRMHEAIMETRAGRK